MPSAIIRADASHSIGLGHMVRSTALAARLLETGWNCRLLTSSESVALFPARIPAGLEVVTIPEDDLSNPERLGTAAADKYDVAIIDHYSLSRDYESGARSWADHIMVIDDLADRPHDCDVLLDQNLGRRADDYDGLVAPSCRLLIGPDFSLLGEQFSRLRVASLARLEQVRKPERVMVNFGGSDPHNATLLVLEGLAKIENGIMLDIVLGSGAGNADDVEAMARRLGQPCTVHRSVEDMADLLARCDLVVGACGSSAWERCCLGVPSVVVVTGDDQWTGARGLSDADAIILLGALDEVDGLVVAAAVAALHGDPERWRALGANASRLVDGAGRSRVEQTLRELVDGDREAAMA